MIMKPYQRRECTKICEGICCGFNDKVQGKHGKKTPRQKAKRDIIKELKDQ